MLTEKDRRRGREGDNGERWGSGGGRGWGGAARRVSEPWIDLKTDQSRAFLDLSRLSNRARLEDSLAERCAHTHRLGSRPVARAYAHTHTGRKGECRLSASRAVKLCPGEDDSGRGRELKETQKSRGWGKNSNASILNQLSCGFSGVRVDR